MIHSWRIHEGRNKFLVLEYSGMKLEYVHFLNASNDLTHMFQMNSSHREQDTIPFEIIVTTPCNGDPNDSREYSESLDLESSLNWLQDNDTDYLSEAASKDETILRSKGITERQRQLCLSILNSSDETLEESDDESTEFNYWRRSILKDTIHDNMLYQDESCDLESIHCSAAR